MSDLKSEIDNLIDNGKFYEVCGKQLVYARKLREENEQLKEVVSSIKKESFTMVEKGWRDDNSFIMPDHDKAMLIIKIYNIADKALED